MEKTHLRKIAFGAWLMTRIWPNFLTDPALRIELDIKKFRLALIDDAAKVLSSTEIPNDVAGTYGDLRTMVGPTAILRFLELPSYTSDVYSSSPHKELLITV